MSQRHGRAAPGGTHRPPIAEPTSQATAAAAVTTARSRATAARHSAAPVVAAAAHRVTRPISSPASPAAQ
jgi:hypothetical protein